MPEYTLYAAAAGDPTTITGSGIPMSTLAWGDRLGDLAPTMSWTVPARLDHPDLGGLTPGESIVWLDRDGQLVMGGWLQAISVSPSDEIATYSCVGLMAYFRRRVRRTAISEASIDVLTLARTLIDDAQSPGSAYDIGITTGSETAGRTRAVEVAVEDHEIVGDLFVRFADEDQWEWRTDHAWIAGVPTATLVLRSDLLGRTTAHRAEHGATVDLTGAEWDATQVATTVTVVGSASGDEQLVATASRTPPNIITETVISSGGSDEAALARIADTAAGALQTAPVRVAGVLRPGPDLRIGSFVIGDQCRVVADLGVISVDAIYRISEYAVRVDESGTEQTSVGFAVATGWTE